MAFFRTPAPAQICATPLEPIPKNLSSRFGAHRASIYGTTKAAKTMALTAAAKDQTRESHDRELMGRQMRSKILDEEFPDYQKLLDKAEVDPPPLPCPTSLFPGQPPPYRGKNEVRGGARLDADKVADTGTSSGGAQGPAPLDGQEPVYTGIPPAAPKRLPTITREAAMDNSLEAPFPPYASQMRVDRVTALLSLLLEDPLRFAATNLICKSYSEGDASYIWSK